MHTNLVAIAADFADEVERSEFVLNRLLSEIVSFDVLSDTLATLVDLTSLIGELPVVIRTSR